MLLLSETTAEDAAVLAEKLRNLVQRQRFNVEGNPQLNVTVSIGIAGGEGPALRVDSLARDADAAMYSAKSLGRNQVYVFAEPDDDARIPRAPISPAGRAMAQQVGQIAREAAQAALTALIAPLPHYRGQPSALIASIAVRMAHASSTCPRPRSSASASRRCCTMSARSPCPRRSSRSRSRRSPRPSGAPSSSTRASAR